MNLIDAGNTPDAATAAITAQDVPVNRHPDFLPDRFGASLMLRAEFLVYTWMGQLSPDYSGGLWRFVELSNGGFYMAPDLTRSLRVRCEGNGFDDTLSPDAAGIVATLFALNHFVFERQERLVDAYYLLRDFASTHLEGQLILQAID